MTKLSLPGKTDLWFLPLGGAGEIGMNLNLFGHDNQWLMVDCGVTFNDKLGIEVITPDPSAILPYQKNLVGLVLTHAHEDHIGAVPYLWPALKCPVYATPFTATILRQKIKEYTWAKEVNIIEIPLSGTVQIGHFKIEFITLTHSIPEPNAVAITTPLGLVLHTGDWKIDPDPLIGGQTDIKRLTELGDQGVLAMVCDSTNVFSNGYSGSESTVRNEINQLISKFPTSRVTVACFASNVARLETIAFAAQANGRKVALLGRSLKNITQAAFACGYLKGISNFIEPETAISMPPEKVLFISTGSQGEPRSALARIAAQKHPVVKIREDDVIIFSSRIIPGNEKSISIMQNNLIKQGAQIITSSEEQIHVSGHPAREELIQMYKWLRPQILIPVHGEARHMKAQEQLGKECGIKEIVVPTNGSLINIKPSHTKIINHVQNGRWGLDGDRMLDLNSMVLKDRYKISVDGVVFVNVPLLTDKSNKSKITYTVDVVGVVEYGKDYDSLVTALKKKIANAMSNHNLTAKAREDLVITTVKRHIADEYGKRPLIRVSFTNI